MTLYQITVTEVSPELRTTRIIIGCEEPAREAFSTLCHVMTGKGMVSFRIVQESPQRPQAERERSEAFLDMVFKDKGSFH